MLFLHGAYCIMLSNLIIRILFYYIEIGVNLRILTIGDVVSKQGSEYLRQTLPKLKKEYSADIVIVNGENSAVGNGVLPQSADYIFDSGADVITLGNHSLRRPEIYDYLDEREYIIRPANFHSSAPGRGVTVIDKGYTRLAVINLQGIIYLEPIRNPFDIIDNIIDDLNEQGVKNIIVDFHAEATSEKRAMGFYLDGRVSAIFGTHTHVQTSDNQILPNGTGYITDIGMTGPLQSVLGVSAERVIEKLRTGLPVRFKNEDIECAVEGCLFEIDKCGKTVYTEIFRR